MYVTIFTPFYKCIYVHVHTYVYTCCMCVHYSQNSMNLPSMQRFPDLTWCDSVSSSVSGSYHTCITLAIWMAYSILCGYHICGKCSHIHTYISMYQIEYVFDHWNCSHLINLQSHRLYGFWHFYICTILHTHVWKNVEMCLDLFTLYLLQCINHWKAYLWHTVFIPFVSANIHVSTFLCLIINAQYHSINAISTPYWF